MDKAKYYTFTKVEDKDHGITLTIKVDSAYFLKEKEHAYNELAPKVSITGFRPGKAPRNLIEARISQEMYEHILNHILPETTSTIIEEEGYVPLNQVQYEVKKMADSEGIEYTANFIIMPKFKLPDFAKISVKKENAEPSESEIEEEIVRLVVTNQKKAAKKDEEIIKKASDLKFSDLKDEDAVKVDAEVKTLNELKDKVKTQLSVRKAYEVDQKFNYDVIEEVVKAAKISVPKKLIENQANQNEQNYKGQIEQLGLNFEDFIKSQNKTVEDLRKEWMDLSAKQLANEILFIEVIRDQKMQVTVEEIQAQLERMDEKVRESYSNQSGIRYLSNLILEEKAFQYIKNQVKVK